MLFTFTATSLAPGMEEVADTDSPFFPLRPWHVWLPELLFATTIVLCVLPTLLLTLSFAALGHFCGLLWLLRFYRTCRFPKYRRDPKTCRVAIVGCGWSGLAIAARLQELGVPFVGFEASDDVGGTWHPSRRYPGLALHSPAYGAAFAGFPYPAGGVPQSTPDERPSGEAMHAYISRFAAERDLLRHFAFSTSVSDVRMNVRTRTATLKVARHGASLSEGGDGQEDRTRRGHRSPGPQPHNQRSDQAGRCSGGSDQGGPPQPAPEDDEEWLGPFDMVIYASLASQPVVPTLPGTFYGHACHACEVNDSLLAKAAAGRQRVVVVGAGRSGCDQVLALLKAGVENDRITWLVRRPYYFWKLERCWHRCTSQNKERWLPRLRGFGAAMAFWICDLCPSVGWRLFWALDYVYTPHAQLPASQGEAGAKVGTRDSEIGTTNEWTKWCSGPAFHMGLLDAPQRRVLAKVRRRCCCRSAA